MVRSIVIAEKPSQARLYRAAVGDQYGEIVAARGHLFALVEPERLNAAWRSWSPGLLRRGRETYPSDFRDTDSRKVYAVIRRAAVRAERVYVATDPDREGEGIGMDVVSQLEKDLSRTFDVLRVLPLAEDPVSLRRAFAEARPGRELRPLYMAYRARTNVDHIANLSLTRTATTTLRAASAPRGVVLSLGRVLTPTMGIVSRREREIADFVPRDHYRPWVDVEGEAGRVRLHHAPAAPAARKSPDAPDGDRRLYDRARAEVIARAARGWTGPIGVREVRRKQAPPPLLSLAGLQVLAQRRLNWGAVRSEAVLQRLYAQRRIVTYPRSSEVSLPEAEIARAPTLMAALVTSGVAGTPSWSGEPPVIRRARGAYSDRDLKGAAHHAIVPNVATAHDWPSILLDLDPDERALFDLIARRTLAALGPDRVYDATRLTVRIAGEGFQATGIVERSPGWREAEPPARRPAAGKEDAGPTEGPLPPFRDGAGVRVVDEGVQTLKTQAPPRYTEATLVTAMIEAWRLVEDPERRERLKGAEGIGTPATRSGVVENLLRRGYATLDNKKALHATQTALDLEAALLRLAPRLLDVAATAEMELALDRVQAGDTSPLDAVDAACATAEAAVTAMIAARGTVALNPTPRDGKGRSKRPARSRGSGRRTSRRVAKAT